MSFKKLIFNTENRFKTVESSNIMEALKYKASGVIKSLLRGSIIGYSLGYIISGGDPETSYFVAGLGALCDVAQDGIRSVNLISMRKRSLEKYLSHKNRYRNLGIVD